MPVISWEAISDEKKKLSVGRMQFMDPFICSSGERHFKRYELYTKCKHNCSNDPREYLYHDLDLKMMKYIKIVTIFRSLTWLLTVNIAVFMRLFDIAVKAMQVIGTHG